ncbi:MAG: YigZ family protein [Clostridiales bacterium]|nr:YigZ family protein [Clostridiales bacterium]
MKPYRTLLKRAAAEFVVNKSRFIGSGAPAETEEAALSFLSEIRRLHKDASHNCYAYIVGANMGTMRYSDDGEPGGTAGMPIIEHMKSRGVTNCAVVVTRYFGGVLLGAGGLVRAYAEAAKRAVDACGVGAMHPTARLMVDVPYPLLNRVDFFLKSAPVAVEDRAFAEHVTLSLLVRTADEDEIIGKLVDLSEGNLAPVRIEEFYYAWKEGEGE